MFNRDYQQTTDNIVSFIRKTLKETDFSRVVIGVSGGIDSATATMLLVKSLGRENVYPVILPYSKLHTELITDAEAFVSWLKFPAKNITKINIQSSVDEICKSDKDISTLRKGNIMSRMRMIYLYDLAKKYQALVCGTENKTEYMLGYFTRYGDEASDFEPLRALYKTEVRELARHIGVPKKIIERHPTAGLWPGQTDEEELGFSYQEADQILHLIFDKKMTRQQVLKASGLNKKVVDKVLARVKLYSFKHSVPKIMGNSRQN